MFIILAFIRSGLEKLDLDNDLSKLDAREITRFWRILSMLLEQSGSDSGRSEAEKKVAEDIQKKVEKNGPEKKKETSEKIFKELLDSLK